MERAKLTLGWFEDLGLLGRDLTLVGAVLKAWSTTLERTHCRTCGKRLQVFLLDHPIPNPRVGNGGDNLHLCDTCAGWKEAPG